MVESAVVCVAFCVRKWTSLESANQEEPCCRSTGGTIWSFLTLLSEMTNGKGSSEEYKPLASSKKGSSLIILA